MVVNGLHGWSPASAKRLDGNRSMSSGVSPYSGSVPNEVFWRSRRRSLPVNTVSSWK
jgi:hypothetical protein